MRKLNSPLIFRIENTLTFIFVEKFHRYTSLTFVIDTINHCEGIF